MIGKALHILREDGTLVFRRRTSRYLQRRVMPKREVLLPVSMDDVLQANWKARPANGGAVRVHRIPDRLVVNWVIPPIAKGSGGHHGILRFVRGLEMRGHSCNIIVYDPGGIQTVEEARVIIRRHFPAMEANVWTSRDKLEACDALIATAWQTAYPVFNAATTARKFYFIQDYEPLFYAAGTESVLAENTYKFGLHGITLGPWLSRKLSTEFGMHCDHFAFSCDLSTYRFTNRADRTKIVFYARPCTPRRGFELGVFALALFVKNNPGREIHMVGADLSGYRLPFEFVNHGVLGAPELNQLYNESAAALVISLTNSSFLPLELLSTGCIPVVNDAANNRLMSANPYIEYAEPSPQSLAQRLQETVNRVDLPRYAREAAASVQALSWDASTIRFEEILIRGLGGHTDANGADANGADAQGSFEARRDALADNHRSSIR